MAVLDQIARTVYDTVLPPAAKYSASNLIVQLAVETGRRLGVGCIVCCVVV